MKRFLLLALVMNLAVFSAAYGWAHVYGGDKSDEGYCVQQTSEGGYIVVGQTSSFGAEESNLWLLKLDTDGDTEWTHIYGGSREDCGKCVQQTSDGGYIVVGYTQSFGEDWWGDIWLLKTDAEGDTLWTRLYEEGRGYSVQQTSDGGYIIAGQKYDHVWLLKTDSLGDTLWTRVYDDNRIYEYSQGLCVQEADDGGYFITATVQDSGYTSRPGYPDISSGVLLFKTNASGDTLWTRIYYGNGEAWYSVGGCWGEQTRDGGYIVTGWIYGMGTADDIWLLKVDSDGDTLWTRTYGDQDWESGHCVRQTADDGYIITGRRKTSGLLIWDIWLVKTDAEGDTIWTQSYGGTGYNEGRCVEQTLDSGYIITGCKWTNGRDLWLIKTDSLGDTLSGITEKPAADESNWDVVVGVGPEIVLRYKGSSTPHSIPTVIIYDATGRKVDEVRSAEASGIITWPATRQSAAPGVYFIRVESDAQPRTHKVILVK